MVGPLLPVVVAVVATLWPKPTAKDQPQALKAAHEVKPQTKVAAGPAAKASRYCINEAAAPTAFIHRQWNDYRGDAHMWVDLRAEDSSYGNAEQLVFTVRVMSPSGKEEGMAEYLFTASRHPDGFINRWSDLTRDVVDFKLPDGKHKAVITYCVGEHALTKTSCDCVGKGKITHTDCIRSTVELASIEFTTPDPRRPYPQPKTYY